MEIAMHAVSTKAGFKRRLPLVGALATIAAGGLLILAGAANSQSVTPQSVDPVQHFIDCAGVLITAPEVHAANCMPSNNPPTTTSLMSNEDGSGCAPTQDADSEDDVSPCHRNSDDILDNVEDDTQN
jgi:hypothetical protein